MSRVALHFELSVEIARDAADVFAFLRDKHLYPQPPGSPVLALDKTTDGPVGPGTRYREVVRMLPFVRGEILSEVTRFEPPHRLEERFAGASMRGYLVYELVTVGGGTLLVQREELQPLGALRLLAGPMRRMLAARLHSRLDSIKSDLEGGWQVDTRVPGGR